MQIPALYLNPSAVLNNHVRMQTDNQLTNVRESDELAHFKSRWTAENLETEGVVHVEDKGYFLVDKEHPVISLLQQNMSFLAPDTVMDDAMVDGRYYRLSSLAFNVACSSVKIYLFDKKE